MSLTSSQCIHCDWCGKLTNNQNGEYTKPDKVSVGYIHAPDWDKDGSLDICEECAAGHCPFCGSDQIVRLTPAFPGAIGWGGRCKACTREWNHTYAEQS